MKSNLSILLTGVLVLVEISVADAQMIWIEPSRFINAARTEVELKLVLGSKLQGEPLAGSDSSSAPVVDRVTLYRQVGVPEVKIISDPARMAFNTGSEGTVVVAFASNPYQRESSAEVFGSFVRDFGLNDVLFARADDKESQPVRESIIHCGKSLIQSGGKRDNNFNKVVGHPVEIVPLTNPYGLKTGDPIRFRILADGKPVFGARVKIFNKYNNRITEQNIYSQQDGVVETHLSSRGVWLVGVVRMESSQGSEDWKSYRATLIFGVQ